MKIINKRPNYIKSADRINRINQAYTIVFQAINKIEPHQLITVLKGNKH